MDVDVATDQINLNMACIRTTVKLMENLDLRSSDGPNADSPGHAVSRLFIRYFNVLLQGLQTCQQGVLVSYFGPPVGIWNCTQATSPATG